MQVEYQDIALWYGTPDAPAPAEFIQAGAETTITVGVQPADASNHIEVRYRINQRSTETIAARWLWNDSSGKIQYFKVRLPPFRVGDVVEYTAICYCAGRQVPSPEEAKQFASSFRVIGAEIKQTQGRPSGSPAQRAASPQSQVPSKAKISPSASPMRLRGSSPMPFLPINGNGNGRPNGGHHPPAPPAISTPDIGLQFSPCLPDTLRDTLISSLKAAFAPLAPNADLHFICQDGKELIGIWFFPPQDSTDTQARERSLPGLDLLQDQETIGFFFNAALIQGSAQDGWNNSPKRLNASNASPDPNGSIHLTGFSVSFESPDRIVTRIDGFDDRPWPNVDFHLTLTDTLSVSAGWLLSTTAPPNLVTDASWFDFVSALFLAGSLFYSLLFIPAYLLIEHDALGILTGGQATPGSTGGGIGLATAQFINSFREISVPGGFKIDTDYDRVNVAPGGIFTGGTWVLMQRNPTVTIRSLDLAAVNSGDDSATFTFTFDTTDMRGLPTQLTINWSTADADVMILDPAAPTTQIQFSISGAKPRQVLSRNVSVDVRDLDNLKAHASRTINIYVVDDSLPPDCRHQPWLPGCTSTSM